MPARTIPRSAIALAAALLLACGRDAKPPTVPEFRITDGVAKLVVPDVPVPLALRTYDGSGQAVHPDYAAPGARWPQQLFYLAITPYAWGGTKNENPSLYASADGVAWGAAPRAPMPLARPQEGHLSDPDVAYDPDRNELLLYYRQAGAVDRIFLKRSKNGAFWSPPVALFDGAPNSVLSPAIVQRATGDYRMWSVNGGAAGCRGDSTSVEWRHSTDGEHWSAPEAVNLPVPPGQFAWHIDVQWIPEREEYWAVFPVKAPMTCATTAVFLATSTDGVTWHTVSSPVMRAGVIPELRDIVYRSTFAYNAQTDIVTLWYSGARFDGERYTWRLAAQQRTRRELLEVDAMEAAATIPRARSRVRSTFDPP